MCRLIELQIRSKEKRRSTLLKFKNNNKDILISFKYVRYTDDQFLILKHKD